MSKEDLQALRNAYAIAVEDNRILKDRLEKIKKFAKCSKEPMNCDNCPMCEECEELCVNDENLQDIILQIIEGAEDEKIYN